MKPILSRRVWLGLAVAVLACHKPGADAQDAAADAATKAVAQLPGPYSTITLGMTLAELQAAFPPIEDVSACEAHLVGGDAPLPAAVPGADKKAHSQCARSLDIGGLTFAEVADIAKRYGEVSSGDAVDVQEGALATYAQVRGAVRAGAVTEAAILEADRGRSGTAYAAVSSVVEQLLKGGLTFARGHSSRRELCALIADSCDDVDPDRVRTYEQGGYTLGQIDADAHSRVVYGKCRTAFLQHEKTLATRFVRRAGALTGIGLARATRADHQLDPATPASFSTYSSRSGLEASAAKLGVIVANALPAAEQYWRGAVALVAPPDQRAGWLSAVAWMRDGRVSRVLVNVGDESKLGDLPATLAGVYGAAGTTKGTVTTWSMAGGVTVVLDIGAATALVVDRPGFATLPPLPAGSAAASLPAVAAGPSDPAPATSAAAKPVAGTVPANPDMAPCCDALQQTMASASDAQRGVYSALLGACRLNNAMTVNSPASARKAQLRQNAATLNLPPLPAACQ